MGTWHGHEWCWIYISRVFCFSSFVFAIYSHRPLDHSVAVIWHLYNAKWVQSQCEYVVCRQRHYGDNAAGSVWQYRKRDQRVHTYSLTHSFARAMGGHVRDFSSFFAYLLSFNEAILESGQIISVRYICACILYQAPVESVEGNDGVVGRGETQWSVWIIRNEK